MARPGGSATLALPEGTVTLTVPEGTATLELPEGNTMLPQRFFELSDLETTDVPLTADECQLLTLPVLGILTRDCINGELAIVRGLTGDAVRFMTDGAVDGTVCVAVGMQLLDRRSRTSRQEYDSDATSLTGDAERFITGDAVRVNAALQLLDRLSRTSRQDEDSDGMILHVSSCGVHMEVDAKLVPLERGRMRDDDTVEDTADGFTSLVTGVDAT
jgi:hypothetical protein